MQNGKIAGQGVADGKQGHVQAANEQCQPEQDEKQANENVGEIGKGLAQDDGLEESHDQHDWRQVPRGAGKQSCQ